MRSGRSYLSSRSHNMWTSSTKAFKLRSRLSTLFSPTSKHCSNNLQTARKIHMTSLLAKIVNLLNELSGFNLERALSEIDLCPVRWWVLCERKKCFCRHKTSRKEITSWSWLWPFRRTSNERKIIEIWKFRRWKVSQNCFLLITSMNLFWRFSIFHYRSRLWLGIITKEGKTNPLIYSQFQEEAKTSDGIVSGGRFLNAIWLIDFRLFIKPHGARALNGRQKRAIGE